MAEEDDSQKTEEPSQKRLDEATERGQVITSKETNSFFMLLAFAMVLVWMVPGIMRQVQYSLSVFIERPDSFEVDGRGSLNMMTDLILQMAGLIVGPLVVFVVSIFAATAIQNRFVFSTDPIVPKLSKISPAAGLKRLFSMRSFTEFAKGILKLALVAFVAYQSVMPYLPFMRQLPDTNTYGMLAFLLLTAKRMLIGVCIVMFFISVADYLYQRFEFYKSMRMSKQEIRDEYKQQEGDPHVKGRLKQIRMERSRKRMMTAVPTADVIVTNPTHYSIALKYDADTMRAPRVVAKGLDNIALRIREIAKENDIPLYENAPLAQVLYATVEVDGEIPAEHYKAVAEVITFVYRVRGRPTQAKRAER